MTFSFTQCEQGANLLLRFPHVIRFRLLKHLLTARLLGNAARVNLWRSLGATIEDRVYVDASAAFLFHPELVTIGRGTLVDGNVRLHAWGPIKIGRNVVLSPETVLLTGSHDIHSPDFAGHIKPITIGDYAWLGLGATALPGVQIGDGAVVGARAVVAKDVPPYAVVVGNPAVVVRQHGRVPFTYIPADWKLKREK